MLSDRIEIIKIIYFFLFKEFRFIEIIRLGD